MNSLQSHSFSFRSGDVEPTFAASLTATPMQATSSTAWPNSFECEIPKSDPQKKKSTACYRVLIIEDDEAIARLLEVNISRAGLECQSANDGAEGLRTFCAWKPHLVLLDLALPTMNGFEICEAIRKFSATPIVMLTARSETCHQMKGFRLGADDYVIKPFDPQVLVARTVAHLRRVYRYDNGHIEMRTGDKRSTPSPTAPTPEENSLPKSNQRRENGVNRSREILSSMPEGWAACEACHYMGPLKQFPKKFDGYDHTQLTCPNCNSAHQISFGVS